MSERPSRSELAWLGALLLLTLAVYLPGLGNETVFDDEYLVSGALFREYASALELKARWLSYGTFVWIQGLFGDGWWKQRLFNVAVHLGTVAALWALYRELLRHVAMPPPDPGETTQPVAYSRSPAIVLAIGFFALNPVAVYAVAYLVQRSILLATFFVVLGFWSLARGLASGKAAWHVAAVACYLLAVASKEHAILAPLAAIPIYILVARPSPRRLAVLAGSGIALAGLAAGILSYRYGEILGKPFDEFSRVYLAQLAQLEPSAEKNAFGLSILNEAYLFFHYGLRWMLPWEGWMSINLRPPFPVSWASFPQALGILGYLGVLAGGFYLLLRYRTWPALVGVALLVPALLYPTEFSTVWVQDPFVLYRSYLWAIGIPGLVFFLVYGPSPRVLAVVGVLLAALLAWQALDRVFSLSTPERAWTDAIAKLPKDPRAVGRWFPYVNRGSVYVDQNQFEMALRDFQVSEALGDMGIGAANSASLLSAKGQHRQALAALDRAQKQGYTLYNLHFQRGLALAALGRNAEALQSFETVRAMNPPSPTREQAFLHIGRLGMQVQNPQLSIVRLEELLRLDPRHRDARHLLAMAYVTQQEHEKARQLLDKVIEEEPNRRAYYARALANYGLKRKAEALADIENAIRRGPEDPHLREWHARIRALP